MLTSLAIKNFRSLHDFQVESLGRVNLIVGKNNSGKSTVLEALRIYAANANRSVLEAIAAEHDEKYLVQDDGDDADALLPFQDLFTGRQFPDEDNVDIKIGEIDDEVNILTISHVLFTETADTKTNESTGEVSTSFTRKIVSKDSWEAMFEETTPALNISKGDKRANYPLKEGNLKRRFSSSDISGAIPCGIVPTQFISVDELADGWDKIVFTEHEDVVKKALRIVSPDFENITFVRNETFRPSMLKKVSFQRSARVKLANMQRPIPLNSLGDGVLRVLQLAIKMLPAKGGVLLIDEFENGLHYSIQEKVWALLFEMSQALDFQVFATTHSWDCIESFSKVAVDRTDIRGVLFRVGKSVRESDRGRVIATVFEEEALSQITQAQVEVR